MRGRHLEQFDFDHDLNWFALFFSPEGGLLGRFGGRDADTPGKYHSLLGLRYALEKALDRYQGGERGFMPTGRKAPRYAEEYPAGRKMSATSCIHCHHVHEFRRDAELRAGTWKRENEWIYPPPENLGLTLDRDQGNRIALVKSGSSADRTLLKSGDILLSLGETPVASVADAMSALHRAPVEGGLAVRWQRGGKIYEGKLELARDWRVSDVSWRWSLKSFPPQPPVYGEDLSAQEKQALGLKATQLAFRQGNFLGKNARQAGIQIHDVILGVDGKDLHLSAQQFETYLRLHYRPGEVVTFQVRRGPNRLDVPVKLAE